MGPVSLHLVRERKDTDVNGGRTSSSALSKREASPEWETRIVFVDVEWKAFAIAGGRIKS